MGVILLVEDNQVLRRTLTRKLNRMGHTTIEAEDGVEGQAVLNNLKVDLILSDVHMPNMDGISFFRWVQNTRPENVSKFVFLSAAMDDLDATPDVANVVRIEKSVGDIDSIISAYCGIGET